MYILFWWPSIENSINLHLNVIPISVFEYLGNVIYLLPQYTIECLFYRDLWLVCAVLKYSVFMFLQCQLLKFHCQLQCTSIWRKKCFGKNSATILRQSNVYTVQEFWYRQSHGQRFIFFFHFHGSNCLYYHKLLQFPYGLNEGLNKPFIVQVLKRPRYVNINTSHMCV